MESSPTAASAKPIIIAAMVLNGGSLLNPPKLQNARKYTANFSAGPKRSAKLATSGATSVIMMTANSAPTKDEVKAAVSASPAWPFCAIGWPSKVVATDHGSPGMLNRIEVMAPPNSAPQEMQDKRMIAEVGGMLKVSGNRMATPLAPPRPGSTPMMTPSTTPVNISTRFISVIATPKPWISDWISSIAPPSIQPEPAFDRPF